jgi:hypothetical protein
VRTSLVFISKQSLALESSDVIVRSLRERGVRMHGATIARRGSTMRATPGAHQAQATPDDDPAEEGAPPSQRRTFDVAALASIAGLHDTRGNVPLDRCVPARTSKGVPATITRDEIYMLLYVDGETSLKQISDEIGMSLTDTVAVFLGLLTHGLVHIVGEEPAQSQVVTKFE